MTRYPSGHSAVHPLWPNFEPLLAVDPQGHPIVCGTCRDAAGNVDYLTIK